MCCIYIKKKQSEVYNTKQGLVFVTAPGMLPSDRAGCRGRSERGGFRASNYSTVSASGVGGENSVIVQNCPDSCLEATIQSIIQWAANKKQVLHDKPRAVKDKFPAVAVGGDSSNNKSQKASKCTYIVYVNSQMPRA